MGNKQLVELAKKAKDFSYSPYSNFKVGAALLCDDGTIYTGCNIENAAYGPSNCAERTAIFKAVSAGKRNFKKLAIISDSKTPTYPCGICRQVINEFAPNLEIIASSENGKYVLTNLKELLPNAFNL